MAGTKEADGAPAGPVKQRGAFILFEGVDRCGKTTQANLLVESLKDAGHDACFMRFPGEPFASRRCCCAGGRSHKYRRDTYDAQPSVAASEVQATHTEPPT